MEVDQRQREAPAEAAAAPEVVEDDEEEALSRECLKLLVLIGVIVAIVLLGQEIGSALLRTRGFLRTHVPLGAFLPTLFVVSGVRRLVPPLFYCVPIGTLAMLYLVSALGWARGALVYQALKLGDVAWFFVVRRCYAAPAAVLLDGGGGADARRLRRWLPSDVLRLLRVLDARWKSLIAPPGPAPRRVATVALLGAAWATDEMVTLYFLATRCALDAPFFAAAWASVLVATTPEALVKARAVVGLVNAASESDWGVLLRALRHTPPWLIAAFALISGGATVVVHGVHLRLIWESAPDDDADAVELPRGRTTARDAPPSAGASDRDERKRAIVATQRRDLEAA